MKYLPLWAMVNMAEGDWMNEVPTRSKNLAEGDWMNEVPTSLSDG